MDIGRSSELALERMRDLKALQPHNILNHNRYPPEYETTMHPSINNFF